MYDASSPGNRAWNTATPFYDLTAINWANDRSEQLLLLVVYLSFKVIQCQKFKQPGHSQYLYLDDATYNSYKSLIFLWIHVYKFYCCAVVVCCKETKEVQKVKRVIAPTAPGYPHKQENGVMRSD